MTKVTLKKDAERDTLWANITGFAMYARFNEAKTFPQSYIDKSDNPETVFPYWTVDLLVDKATAAFLEEKGVALRGTGTTKFDPQNQRYVQFIADKGLQDEYDGTYVEFRKSTMRKQYKNGQVVMKDGKPVFEPAELPIVQDSAGNPVPNEVLIGNGSTLKVRGTVSGRKFGDYRLRLVSAGILDLVEYSAGSKGTFVYDGQSNQNDTADVELDEAV